MLVEWKEQITAKPVRGQLTLISHSIITFDNVQVDVGRRQALWPAFELPTLVRLNVLQTQDGLVDDVAGVSR